MNRPNKVIRLTTLSSALCVLLAQSPLPAEQTVEPQIEALQRQIDELKAQ